MSGDLTPEEKHRIYLEEKARIEAITIINKENIQKKNEKMKGLPGFWSYFFFVIMSLTIFGYIWNGVNQHHVEYSDSPASSSISTTIEEEEKFQYYPQPEAPKLEVQSWSWGEVYDYAIAEGKVKNISSEPLKNVEAVLEVADKNGNFISSEGALIEYDPLLPGQSSPFKVHVRWNPAMQKASLGFKELMGSSILHKEKGK